MKSTTTKTMSALEAKNRFGELLMDAQRGPVTIEKHGKPVAVVLSQEDYERFYQAKLDILKAEIAKGVADVEAGRVVDSETVFGRAREIVRKGGAPKARQV